MLRKRRDPFTDIVVITLAYIHTELLELSQENIGLCL